MNNIIAAAKKDSKILFLLFWFFIGVLYLPAYKAGFDSDFSGLLQYYHTHTFSEFINRDGFSVKSLYQFTHLQLYVWIKLFGTHPIPWFLLLTGLHALNGVVVYNFFKLLFKDFKIESGELIAFCGTLLFLFNPNITEITIWKGGYHYLTGILMQFLILTWARNYLVGMPGKYPLMIVIVFFLSTYTLEIFYVTPFLLLFLILGYHWKSIIAHDFPRAFKVILLPQVILFLLHLVTFRICYGGWIAHYGTNGEVFLTLKDMLPKVGKYLLYIVFMSGHWPEQYRMKAYQFLENPYCYYSLCVAVLAATVVLVARFRRVSGNAQVATFLLGAACCSLFIVMPIYFDPLFSLYNSRRAYQTGLFVYILIAVVLFSLFKNRKIALTLFCLYLLLSVGYTVGMVQRWRHAGKIFHGIMRTFQWQHAKGPVVLLNLPTYYRDVRVIPANDENEFNGDLMVFGYDTATSKVYSVTSYNMVNSWDGAHVNVLDSSTLKITLNQWGSWWMYNYLGATSYENELYRADMYDGHEYKLHFKKKPAGMVILFQQGEQWREVDMKKQSGEEQW